MIDYKQELNEEQYAVVTAGDGPCLVLAGAGSGKTRTITYRVAYLLEHNVDPSAMLLVTFTNKAANEMMHRVGQLIPEAKKLPWAGTFHHIAYKILRKYAPLLGYTNQFSILDSQDSLDLLKICLKLEGINRNERRFPSAKVLLSIISYARNAETTIHDVLDLQHPRFTDLADTIGRIAEEYHKRKREANAMDFDDLLVNLYLLLLKDQRVREHFSTQFHYVLVDEYQDTNKIQASIVKLFASHHHNLLVVGDDAQSIYSFRAADIQNILAFEQHFPQAKIFKLETNYRSTPNILNLANDVISNNSAQFEKELKSARDPFAKPEVHAFLDGQEEAVFIAERMLSLRDEEGVSLNEMAVLFRAAYHSQALEVELTKRDIPYEFRGGIRFFERAHIKDVLSFLRIKNNLHDAIAWSRVLNMQVGIGPASAQKAIETIKTFTHEDQLVGIGNIFSARGRVGWNDFFSIWESMHEVHSTEPSALIHAIIDSKYAEFLEMEHPDYRERLQDLEQLANFAERQSDLNQFLGEASLQESYTGAKSSSQDDDDEEKVVLSTIHQAKGLEWEVVFVLNVAQGQFPSERSSSGQGLEEERRLFYVAITRAKNQLYMSYPMSGNFSSFLQGPSLFLDEIDQRLIHHERAGGSTIWNASFSDPTDGDDDVSYEPLDEDMPRTSFLKSLDEL